MLGDAVRSLGRDPGPRPAAQLRDLVVVDRHLPRLGAALGGDPASARRRPARPRLVHAGDLAAVAARRAERRRTHLLESRRRSGGRPIRGSIERVELRRCEIAILTGLQITDEQRPELRSDDAARRVPHGVAHAPHEVVSAFRHDDLEPSGPVVFTKHLDDGGSGRAVVQLDAVAEAIEGLAGDSAGDPHAIGLRHVKPRVQQPVHEVAVGRHQEQTFGVVVEPADRHESIRLFGDEPRHGLAPARIVERRHDAVGLEQHDRRRWLRRADANAVESHVVVRWIDLGAQLGHHLAVHGHAAVHDRLLGMASRHQTGPRQMDLESDLGHRLVHRRSVVAVRGRSAPGDLR